MVQDPLSVKCTEQRGILLGHVSDYNGAMQ